MDDMSNQAEVGVVGVRVVDVLEAGGKTEGAWGCAPGIGSEAGLEDGDRERRGAERDGIPGPGEIAFRSASEMTPLAPETSYNSRVHEVSLGSCINRTCGSSHCCGPWGMV